MRKSLLASTTTGLLVLLLMTACSEDGKDTAATETEKAPATKVESTKTAARQTPDTSTAEAAKPDTAAVANWQEAPIMNQPVDFSTPETVSKTLQDIKQQAGARAARKLESAMGFIMTYDLGVGRDEAKMYKKLNGKTPNQIIAMMRK